MTHEVPAPSGVEGSETVEEGDVCDYWPGRGEHDSPVTARVTRISADESGTQIVVQHPD